MVQDLYTIGFTKKTAQTFFDLLKENGIDVILDIRLHNTSQLAAFAKYPDIEYFLNKICNITYIHDTLLSPTEATLKGFKKKEISWEQYVSQVTETMEQRKVGEHIKANYSPERKICLLCSEATAEQCHRKFIAEEFQKVFTKLGIVHL